MSDRDSNRSYSLANLEDAVEDAITSDCTPEEIYDTIRTTLRRNLTYHRICVRTANEVLRLVHGTEHKDKVINLHEKELDSTLTEWPDYTELPDRVTYTEKEMTHQEMEDAGYEMTGEGIWWPKDDNVTEETPDYNNPRVCAEIDQLAGDNRN